MKTLQSLLCCTALLLINALAAARAADGDPDSESARQAFSLTAPTEFRGVWNKQFQPFLNPVDMQSWANVRVESIDASDGSVSGHFDVYVRSICYDVVDEPFKGTFDGKVLHVIHEFTHCPGMKPLQLTLWKEADGFHGRTMGSPITINKVITTAANP
jgi:hypothetical protein